MPNLQIVGINEVKQPVNVNLKMVIPIYSQIVSEKCVKTPIIVEKSTMVVLKGWEILEALKILSADRIPILQVDSAKVKVNSLYPGLKSITLEDIIRAGVKGPRLPYGSFNVQIEGETPKVEVDLNTLGAWKCKVEKLRVYNSTLELLYRDWPTPLVKLKSFSAEERSVWAKLEGVNPFSNSVKDRTAWAMITDALENGTLSDLLYEVTSTNTGIAIAAIANILGRRARIFLPKSVQKSADILLKILGADVMRMPVNLTVEAVREVDMKSKTDGATYLNQFENDANLRVHLKHTARELDEQLMSVGLTPDYIIGCLGTSGHMSAISIYFKSKYGDSVKIIGVQPALNEVIPGIRRVETGMKWIHWTKFDKIIDVTRREAIEGLLTIARKEGLLVGLSAGAVFSAFTKIATCRGVYVLIFPDTGYKYMEQLREYLLQTKEL